MSLARICDILKVRQSRYEEAVDRNCGGLDGVRRARSDNRSKTQNNQTKRPFPDGATGDPQKPGAGPGGGRVTQSTGGAGVGLGLTWTLSSQSCGLWKHCRGLARASHTPRACQRQQRVWRQLSLQTRCLDTTFKTCGATLQDMASGTPPPILNYNPTTGHTLATEHNHSPQLSTPLSVCSPSTLLC